MVSQSLSSKLGKRASVTGMLTIFGTTLFAAILFTSLSISPVSAETPVTSTEIIPLNATIAIEKTILTLSIPENNHMPWASIEGKVAHPVSGHPVIIQIYDDDNSDVDGNNLGAVHFAQTSISSDGTYKHRFRIADHADDHVVNIFEGDYTVKIFKVVHINSGLDAL